MAEPQTNDTGRKKIKLFKMLSDEATADMAQATWESSSAYREEQQKIAEEQRRWANPEVGDEMPDGTFYLGRFQSKDGTQKDWFAAAEDAQDGNGKRLSLNFNEAAEYARNSKAHGHDDWMVPPGYYDGKGEPDILNALFNNKAKIGGFDETGSNPSGWYWSSSPYYFNDVYARIQRFSDGDQFNDLKRYGLSVRFVRSLTI